MGQDVTTGSAPTLTERLVTRLASLGSRHPSRRSVLAAATLTGTALAVDPWGYLTRPQSAYASVCGPGAACSDGWSAMCCSINAGSNTCPPNTYPGGWWKADRSSFCGGAARYYIDCNAKPGHHFRCHCNQGSCDHRFVAWNVFRYGQCNTQIRGTTAVVCRQISCLPPWRLYPGDCGHSSATDNNTARHNAPCLTRRNTYPLHVTYPPGRHLLHAGQSLHQGDRLVARDRHVEAVLGPDGNLVIRNARGIVWQTNTPHAGPGSTVRLDPDGQLFLLDRAGRTQWRTRATTRRPQPVLRMLNDGRLSIEAGGRPVWSTRRHPS